MGPGGPLARQRFAAGLVQPSDERLKEKGWSKGLYKPSATQEIYLSQRYHFKQLDFEYIVDTNFWNLLRDASDPNWIEAYKALP